MENAESKPETINQKLENNRYCVRCKHHFLNEGIMQHECQHPKLVIKDLVTGKTIPATCFNERHPTILHSAANRDFCGYEGNLYEPKSNS